MKCVWEFTRSALLRSGFALSSVTRDVLCARCTVIMLCVQYNETSSSVSFLVKRVSPMLSSSNGCHMSPMLFQLKAPLWMKFGLVQASG